MAVKKYRLEPVLGAREQSKREAERLLAARAAQLAEAEEELARRERGVESCRGRQASARAGMLEVMRAGAAAERALAHRTHLADLRAQEETLRAAAEEQKGVVARTPIPEGGFVTSEAVQKAQEQRRIRADIERQLRALPGVTVALVTVVMPQDPTLELNPYPASASVVVVHKEQSAPFNEQQIQNLVSKGVPKLKPEDVSVTISQQQPRPIPRRGPKQLTGFSQ